MRWTMGEVKVLRSMHSEGYSATIVAEKLKKDRNAVMGKAFRLGLTWESKHTANGRGIADAIVSLCKSDKNKTLGEIADEVGCSYRYAAAIVRAKGLSKRPHPKGLAPGTGIIALGRAAQALGLTVSKLQAAFGK